MTTLSVSIFEYTLHIDAAPRDAVATAHHLDQEVSGGAGSLGKALRLYVHSLDPRVNGYLVRQ